MEKVFRLLIEKYPEERKYAEYLEGNLPKGLIIDGDKIIKKGKARKEVRINHEDIEGSCELIKDFLSSLQKKKKDTDMTDWKSIKKNKIAKESIIIRFASDKKKQHNLTSKQYKELLSLIYLGIFVKHIKDDDVVVENKRIIEINGLEYIDGEFCLLL